MRWIVNSCGRRLCALALLALAAGGAVACDPNDEITGPEAAGSIAGTVTIDGAGASGITVALSNGQTATTGATGTYSFTNVPSGAYTVSISGFPGNVSFPSTVQAAVVATPGQAVSVNFAGSRVTSTATHTGTLSFAGGDASHNTFVFNAPQPKSASLTRASSGSAIRLTPASGFSPSTLPELNGTVNGTAVTLSGAGNIASASNVSVTATGTLVNGRLDITIVVGADGKLPGGQSISYRYVDN